ncbi:MAG TPA: XRE family transcriptional regulator [Treponema sp.]|nr:XRE family transcriptional regulator [Treponema sp.]
MNRLQQCLSNNMKRYRKEKGLSQEKLAELSGVSANYIALIESGKNFPSLKMLGRIAGALGIDELDLFDKQSLTFFSKEKLRTDLLYTIQHTINEVFDNTNDSNLTGK